MAGHACSHDSGILLQKPLRSTQADIDTFMPTSFITLNCVWMTCNEIVVSFPRFV